MTPDEDAQEGWTVCLVCRVFMFRKPQMKTSKDLLAFIMTDFPSFLYPSFFYSFVHFFFLAEKYFNYSQNHQGEREGKG